MSTLSRRDFTRFLALSGTAAMVPGAGAAKGFDSFCPVGPWIETDVGPGPERLPPFAHDQISARRQGRGHEAESPNQDLRRRQPVRYRKTCQRVNRGDEVEGTIGRRRRHG